LMADCGFAAIDAPGQVGTPAGYGLGHPALARAVLP